MPLDDVFFSNVLFNLYCKHGLGQYYNWLSGEDAYIERSRVVKALQFPETRETAKKMLTQYQQRIDELESMLIESETNNG